MRSKDASHLSGLCCLGKLFFLPPCLSPPLSLLPHGPGVRRSGVSASVHCGSCPHSEYCVVVPGPQAPCGAQKGLGLGSLAPRTSLKVILWKRREDPNKVAEECAGMEGGKATFPGRGVQWGASSRLHRPMWGPWAAAGQRGWRHWSRATCPHSPFCRAQNSPLPWKRTWTHFKIKLREISRGGRKNKQA